MYRPVYSCTGDSGHSLQPGQHQQNLNISYIDLYSHCSPAQPDTHNLMVTASEVQPYNHTIQGVPETGII